MDSVGGGLSPGNGPGGDVRGENSSGGVNIQAGRGINIASPAVTASSSSSSSSAASAAAAAAALRRSGRRLHPTTGAVSVGASHSMQIHPSYDMSDPSSSSGGMGSAGGRGGSGPAPAAVAGMMDGGSVGASANGFNIGGSPPRGIVGPHSVGSSMGGTVGAADGFAGSSERASSRGSRGGPGTRGPPRKSRESLHGGLSAEARRYERLLDGRHTLDEICATQTKALNEVLTELAPYPRHGRRRAANNVVIIYK